MAKELGKKCVLPICAPLWLTRIICWIAQQIGVMRMKPSTLNSDKYKIIRQRNWLCDTTPMEKELDFTIDYDLQKGTKEMIAWYKKEKWL